jgi:hypothetical protein
MEPRNGTRAVGCVLIVSVTAAVVASSRLRWTNQERSDRRPAFQPKNGAFGIWGLIFSVSFVHGVMLVVQERGGSSEATTDDDDRNAIAIAALLSVAYLACTVWCFVVPPFDGLFASSASTTCIGVAAASATAASAWRSPTARFSWEEGSAATEALPVHVEAVEEVSAGLLAGWLTVALALSATNASDRLYHTVGTTLWTLVAVVAAVGLWVMSRAAPIAMFPLIWASLMQTSMRCSDKSPSLVAASLAAVCATAAALRR